MFLPALPNVPKTVLLANAQVLKRVPGTHGFPLGLPTTFGRAALKTNPPPSELERFVTMSVGVNQFPVEAVVIPATCQLPMIWFKRPEAFPPISLSLPKGNSYS